MTLRVEAKEYNKELDTYYTRSTQSNMKVYENLVLVFGIPKSTSLKIHNLFIHCPNNAYYRQHVHTHYLTFIL